MQNESCLKISCHVNLTIDHDNQEKKCWKAWKIIHVHVLSGRLIISSPEQGSQGELIVYQWSVVCLSPSVIVHHFKLEYLWSQLASLGQLLCVALLEWGKGSIRFWGRLAPNPGFHGNRKPLLTYNGENDVSTFSRLFLIDFFIPPQNFFYDS